MLVAGTSATVYPAAQFPIAVHQRGGDLLAELEGADVARRLREALDGPEWDLLSALADGAEEGLRRVGRSKQVARGFARARAEVALIKAVYPVGEGCMVDLPTTPTESLPECHVRGTKPQGYGPKDPLCEDCADRARENAEIAEQSEAVVQQMMGFKGRR